ncbi:MAG: hypothetical protein Q7S87_08595 [Agitococcus sp.]|nr:hypothetical protein [Agitococcus sp.]MDO9177628.1 hypothetical protein [Agitococcus sp.]
MPTLAEYEARGIDVTRMSSEQLQAEGYITPLNELPIIIDAPGDYRTRNGRRISISTIAPTLTLSTSAFHAKGSVWKTETQLGINPEYGIWHISGRDKAVGESARDIVAKW